VPPTREEKLETVLDGSVAYGWEYDGRTPPDISAEPLRGYFRRQPDGVLVFEALDENVLARENFFEKSSPRAIVVSTPLGAGVLLDTRPRVGGSSPEEISPTASGQVPRSPPHHGRHEGPCAWGRAQSRS
jgi:hypothetical protein